MPGYMGNAWLGFGFGFNEIIIIDNKEEERRIDLFERICPWLPKRRP